MDTRQVVARFEAERQALARTVGNDAEVENELRHLIEVVSG